MSTMSRRQRLLLTTAAVAALGLSACSADEAPPVTAPDPDHAADLRSFDADCAGHLAHQERMVELDPVTPADRAAKVDAGIHINYTEDDRACVDLYVWANGSPWTPEVVTVTAEDESGLRWTLSGGVQETNEASLVLSAGLGCVRFTGQVTARRGDDLAVWRAEGRSKRCP